MLPVSDGLLALDQTFTGSDIRTLVTHDAFVLACVEVVEGRLSFPLPSGSIEPPTRFVLAIPPRSVLPMQFEIALVRSHGIAGFSPLVTNGPALLEQESDGRLLDRYSCATRCLRTGVEAIEAGRRGSGKHRASARPAPRSDRSSRSLAFRCKASRGLRGDSLSQFFSGIWTLSKAVLSSRASV